MNTFQGKSVLLIMEEFENVQFIGEEEKGEKRDAPQQGRVMQGIGSPIAGGTAHDAILLRKHFGHMEQK